MKTIKMILVNGALYSKNARSIAYLKSTGLSYSGGYLDLNSLVEHVNKYGFKIEVV